MNTIQEEANDASDWCLEVFNKTSLADKRDGFHSVAVALFYASQWCIERYGVSLVGTSPRGTELLRLHHLKHIVWHTAILRFAQLMILGQQLFGLDGKIAPVVIDIFAQCRSAGANTPRFEG
jgi:hypothetical protein